MDTSNLVLLLIIGIGAGMLSGFVGVGGGIIMVPAFVFLLGTGQKTAQGTSLAVLMFPIVAIAVYNYYKAGHVNFKFAAIVAISFLVGSYFGSKLAISLNPYIVKKVFGLVMLLIALKLIFSK